MEHESLLTISDSLMIAAVLIAPFVAVHVQKKLEHLKEDRERKLRVFKTLMATRAATISGDHVQALNMIDLEFQGNKYKNVTTAWKSYLDHLGSYPKDNKEAQAVWADKRVDLLAKLLSEMGASLGYTFDDVHIKKSIYAPEAHAQTEDEHLLIRRGLIRLLYGDSQLKMDVTSFPISEDEVKEQKELRQGIKELIDGERELPVSVKSNGDA
jgi:hypothetical protein